MPSASQSSWVNSKVGCERNKPEDTLQLLNEIKKLLMLRGNATPTIRSMHV